MTAGRIEASRVGTARNGDRPHRIRSDRLGIAQPGIVGVEAFDGMAGRIDAMQRRTSVRADPHRSGGILAR
jgi:hypothetical protein